MHSTNMLSSININLVANVLLYMAYPMVAGMNHVPAEAEVLFRQGGICSCEC